MYANDSRAQPFLVIKGYHMGSAWFEEALSDPLGSLEGLALHVIATSPEATTAMENRPWAPLGLLIPRPPAPEDDRRPPGFRVKVEKLGAAAVETSTQ